MTRQKRGFSWLILAYDPAMNTQSVISGFSLLELMICLCLAAILALLSYPSMHRYLQRSYCLEGKLQLLEAATRLEAYYASHQNYSGLTLSELGIAELTEHKSHQLSLESYEQNYEILAHPRHNECPVYRMSRLGLEKDMSSLKLKE